METNIIALNAEASSMMNILLPSPLISTVEATNVRTST
jgi:hypothetical protein